MLQWVVGNRSVSDIDHCIFSQGLFMIISDLMKMVVVLIFMFYMNWTNLDCDYCLCLLLFLPEFFNENAEWLSKKYANCQYESVCARTGNRNENCATFTREN
jgi:hypothetical protein